LAGCKGNLKTEGDSGGPAKLPSSEAGKAASKQKQIYVRDHDESDEENSPPPKASTKTAKKSVKATGSLAGKKKGGNKGATAVGKASTKATPMKRKVAPKQKQICVVDDKLSDEEKPPKKTAKKAPNATAKATPVKRSGDFAAQCAQKARERAARIEAATGGPETK